MFLETVVRGLFTRPVLWGMQERGRRDIGSLSWSGRAILRTRTRLPVQITSLRQDDLCQASVIRAKRVYNVRRCNGIPAPTPAHLG